MTDPLKKAMAEARQRYAAKAARRKAKMKMPQAEKSAKTKKSKKWDRQIWLTIMTELEFSFITGSQHAFGDNARHIAFAIANKLKTLYPSFTKSDIEIAILLHKIDHLWPSVAKNKGARISVAKLLEYDTPLAAALQPTFAHWDTQSAVIMGTKYVVSEIDRGEE